MQCYQPLVLPREEVVKVRGLDYRVLHWGPTTAPPVFLLHGFQDAADTFQFLVDALPRELRFVAPDWRGFGGSGRSNSPYWFPDYLADLEVLLDTYADGDAVTLIGHSMGGNIAGLYAGARPLRVRRLVSLEGFGLPRVAVERAPDQLGKWLDQLRKGVEEARYESAARLAGTLQRRNPRLPAAIATFLAEAWTRPVDGGVMLRFDPWHRLVNPVLYRREEAEACWQRVEASTLLLLGGQSEYRRHLEQNDGVDELARFRACFRHLEVEDFPQLGHMLHHEDPAAVAAVIGAWLSRHG